MLTCSSVESFEVITGVSGVGTTVGAVGRTRAHSTTSDDGGSGRVEHA